MRRRQGLNLGPRQREGRERETRSKVVISFWEQAILLREFCEVRGTADPRTRDMKFRESAFFHV